MKQSWDRIFEWIIKHEGGFVDHPDDPGGMTNLGVTRKVWADWIKRDATEADMRSLTKDDVKPLYKKWYFDKVRGDDLPAGVDWCVVDVAVNSGPSRAAKMLQKCVAAKQDGAIGPMTLKAVADENSEKLVGQMHEVRQKFYDDLGKPMFIKGWTRRNDETRDQALDMLGDY